MKQDITGQSDNELSMLVFNMEYLYGLRRSYRLRSILEELFIFTDEQWDVLEQDLK